MRALHGWAVTLGDTRGLPVCAVAAVLIALGMIGGNESRADTMMWFGLGLLPLGLLMPRLRNFEVGPGGVKATLAEGDEAFKVVFRAEADRLYRFAYFMCGDPDQARELVESALAKTRDQQRCLASEERGAYALRTLLELLETVEERRWLRGPVAVRAASRRRQKVPAAADARIVAALAELDIPARAAFLLRLDWMLTPEEAAHVLGKPPQVVREDIQRARDHVRPKLQRSTA